jgi:metal-dependent amidase/aminoacylase/carboxypeptidase family protein
VSDSFESAKDAALEVAKFVYEHPELGSEEVQSSRFIIDLLKRNGLEVESPLLGMDTAFASTFGSGNTSWSSPNMTPFLWDMPAPTTLSQPGR